MSSTQQVAFPKHLANTTVRKDPLAKQPADYFTTPTISKMQMQPLLIQHRLVNEDSSGNLKFNIVNPTIHDYGVVTAVGPWTINEEVIPKADEFKNLILKRTIPVGTSWYYEPTRFVLAGAMFHGKGFKSYSLKGKQVTEAYIQIQKQGEAFLNIEEFMKVSAIQVKDAMVRGGIEADLEYSYPLVDFAEDEYLQKVNDWTMSDFVAGLSVKVQSNWTFRGALDNVAKNFTVDEINHHIASGCFFDVVLRPQMWLVKSGESGKFRCGINFNLEYVDIRNPLILQK